MTTAREIQIRSVLARLAKKYPKGCIAYWDSVSNSPWAEAFDQFEKSITQDSNALFDVKCDWFEMRITTLTDHYAKLVEKQREVFGEDDSDQARP